MQTFCTSDCTTYNARCSSKRMAAGMQHRQQHGPRIDDAHEAPLNPQARPDLAPAVEVPGRSGQTRGWAKSTACRVHVVNVNVSSTPSSIFQLRKSTRSIATRRTTTVNTVTL